jgi:hypothetical protein
MGNANDRVVDVGRHLLAALPLAGCNHADDAAPEPAMEPVSPPVFAYFFSGPVSTEVPRRVYREDVAGSPMASFP